MNNSKSLPSFARIASFTGLVSTIVSPLYAAVTPGGTFADKAIITEAGGGEQLTRATSGTGLGPVLVHDFDTPVVVDPTYEILTPSTVALSSGRHLVMYATRFDAHAGTNRAEIISNITLAGAQISAGTSQGFIRRTGGADETVISGGAIINVAADDDVLTLESRRSDNNTNTATLPTREPNYTSAQLLKLDDTWPYLNLQRTTNQAGTVGTGGADVTYEADNSSGTHGSAFTYTAGSADITLNESGLYLVFANTQLEKVAGNNTRTNYLQSITLNGTAVPGATTTTYLRGNANGENAQTGVASVGRIISASAGDILRVRLTMESGGTASTIQGIGTAITAVKLPVAAKYIEVTDTTDQNVLTVAPTPISFNTQVSASNATFTHAGGSTITANNAGDYLFLGSLFTQSDATNDNHDRVIPITRWRQNGATLLDRGQGAAYNRDNGGNRTSGSWNSTLITLAASDTVELTSENVGTASAAFPNTPTMQGLEIASLVVNNDPAIATNAPLTVLPSSTGNVISDAFLDTFDNDTPPTGLTYTVDTAPTGGTLLLSGGALVMGGTFTQDDIDNNLVTFDAGAAAPFTGGFDFTVSDGGASESSTFVINVEWPTTTVTIADDGDVTEGGVSDFVFTADVAPVGADLTVTIAYSGSASSGVDFNGSTTVDILDGQTGAVINVTTLADGLFEGAETITATITDVSGATITGAIGSPSSATFLLSDGANSSPTGTNLSQVISGVGNVPIADIVVIDPDKGASSNVTGTAGEPLFHTNGIANLTNYGDGRADDDSTHDLDATGPALDQASGFSLDLEFIPQAADLVGTVQLWEIGGSSNGSAVLLVDGVPHLLSKANGVAGDAPTDDTTVPGAFNDLNWEPDDTIVVPLNGANALTAGLPACIAVVFDINGNQVKSSVNGSPEVVTALSAQSGLNFRGDHTVNFINAGTGTGGNTSTAGNTFTGPDIKNLVNGNSAVSLARFWNESGGSATGVPGASEVVTATLTISGWSAGAGDLTASSGNGEIYAAGVWSVTGTADAVNAALASVEFVTGGSTADPTVINISIDDGDEDGGGPVTGAIIYTVSAPDPIYVDDSFAGSTGDPIADGDLGDPGAQPATIGLNAFTSLAGALGAVTPTGTIIVNDGDYSSENIILADSVTLQLTDTAGPVQIGDIASADTNAIDLQSNTLELGATNVSGAGINAIISGTGNLNKIGTGLVTIRGVNTYTGTTTITDGMLRIGRVNPTIQGELAGDGPVVVTAPGRLEFAVNVDQSINQTGAISGNGTVATLAEGTVVFDGPGANTFSGGFELGDGQTSSFDGVDQGTKEGFVVVNRSDHLGTGKILSRGSQLRAGSPGVVIPNDIDITNGGFRSGGTVDFEYSGTITTIDGTTRGFGNYGLEGTDLTISGNIVLTAGGNMNFEGSANKDNGTWTVTGDILGPQNVLVASSFINGVVTLSGNLTHAGTTTVDRGTLIFNATQTGGGNFNVNNDAILTGSGSTTSPVTITTNATLAPGASPGIFTTGNLTINGNLEIEADNNTPGTGHDQVVVNGTVTLGAASVLTINSGAGLTAGTFTIIDNADVGLSPVSGTFSSLAEGVTLNPVEVGFDGTITYLGGGDSNDVAINFGAYTTIQENWRYLYYGDISNSGPGADGAPAANDLTNLQSFALDLDPTTAAPGLVVDAGGGTITSLGPPVIWYDPTDGKAYLRHTRRADFASIPLTITDQFSRDLTAFEDSAVAPSVIATGTGASGVAIEAVQTELPVILPVNGGKARYGRIDVTTP